MTRSEKKPLPAHEAHLRAETFAERRRLVDLLTELNPEQWAAASLCDGWQVREVVAHITMPYRYGAPRFLLGFARSGFRFNRYADRAAKDDTAKLTDAELLQCLRDNIEHPWRPPGGGQAGALSHDVIHGLDITEPLGLPQSPPERIRLVLVDAGTKNLAFFGTDLTGMRLIADDVDLSMGDGPREIRMSAREMLLGVTGRTPLPR